MECYTFTCNSLKLFEEVEPNTPPRSYEELANRILLFDSFKAGLNMLENLFNSQDPNSVIITGYTTGGKTTMVRLAESNTEVKTIYLNSDMFTNDVAALHYLLSQLRLTQRQASWMRKESLSETMVAIKQSKNLFNEKFVVVISDFNGFCTKSQSLLYNLNEFIQHGINMSLVLITSSRDCTENLEKRVSSRMSSSTFSLDVPYKTGDQYIEFARNLLGLAELTEELEKMLRMEFNCKDRSIPGLKRFLLSICKEEKGKLVVIKRLKADNHNLRETHVGLVQDQISWLPDLYVLTKIVAYCKRNADHVTNSFRVSDVINWHRVCNKSINIRRFDLGAIRTLMKANLIARLRESERVGLETDFILLISFKFYRNLVESNKDLGDILDDKIYTLR